MNNLDALMRAAVSAAELVREIDGRRKRWLQEQAQEARAKADEMFGDELDAARNKAADAHSAVRAEADRIARTGATAKLPIGARYIEWKRPGRGWPRTATMTKTGSVAVSEVWTTDSIAPANLRYGRPQIGDTVLRKLTKAGKPAAHFVSLARIGGPVDERNPSHGWYAEGVDPNEGAA